MSYRVKEIFKTIQGEGANAGRAAVFVRFSGCNLWNGLEAGRGRLCSAWCDTDFAGTDGERGGVYEDVVSLYAAIEAAWDGGRTNRFVVLTGGEPLLQHDQALSYWLHRGNWFTSVETNGTLPLNGGVDWLTVSPKAGTKLVLTGGNELKLVYPQTGLAPEEFESLKFDHFFLQPMDGPSRDENTRLAIQACLERPKWRLSLQTHKLIGVR